MYSDKYLSTWLFNDTLLNFYANTFWLTFKHNFLITNNKSTTWDLSICDRVKIKTISRDKISIKLKCCAIF